MTNREHLNRDYPEDGAEYSNVVHGRRSFVPFAINTLTKTTRILNARGMSETLKKGVIRTPCINPNLQITPIQGSREFGRM